MSILAGIMIAIGCVCYLRLGGPVGATLFAVGLLSVIKFNFKLFTGQAGMLATREVSALNLLAYWFGNLLGTFIIMCIVMFQPEAAKIQEGAAAIMESRQNVGFIGSFLLAIPCGMLMYMAVTAKETIYTIFCVAAFITGGFYHCVADMFYTLCGASTWPQWVNIFFVTAGNIVGCNIVPYVKSIQSRRKRRACAGSKVQ